MGGRHPRAGQADGAVEEAAEALYGAPLRGFTAERKRLADERRAAGDAAGAARIAALPRPSLGAWVVNRLWREARGDVEALLAAGRSMRGGDAAQASQRRGALARLGAAAAEVLRGDRHAASPATLRRVTATLQSLSAVGGFEPDAPGRLVADRDPPGFEVVLAGATALPPPPARPAAPRRPVPRAERAADRARREREERAAAAELERRAARARREAEERVKRAERVVAQRAAVVEKLAAAEARARAAAKAAEAELDGAREEKDRAEVELGHAREALRFARRVSG